MNKKNYIKRTALPVALFFSMVTLVPALGFQPASAAIDKVQQQSAIKGIVVDEKGEPIIGANVVAEGTTTGRCIQTQCVCRYEIENILYRI